MHEDARRNYERGELHAGEQVNVPKMSDKEVVLTYWGNTRYQVMTDDKHFDAVPLAVRERWDSVSSASSPEDWRRIRELFEVHGWA